MTSPVDSLRMAGQLGNALQDPWKVPRDGALAGGAALGRAFVGILVSATRPFLCIHDTLQHGMLSFMPQTKISAVSNG